MNEPMKTNKLKKTMKKTMKKRKNKSLKNHKLYLKKTLRKSIIKKFLDSKKQIICKSNVRPFEEENDFMIKKNKRKIENIQKKMQHILRKKFVPKKILPNNDFYTYINYEWIQEATRLDEEYKNEKYIVQYDDFRIIQNKVYYQLIDIVKKYIKTNKTKRAKEISNNYHAGLKLLNDEQARKHLNRYVAFLDTCRKSQKEKDAWYFLGIMNKNEIISQGLPFVISLNPDEKEPNIGRISISQPQYSLLDFNVYIDDGVDENYKKNYRRNFFRYIDEMFAAFFGKNHGFIAKDVFDCEQEMIKAMICNKEKDELYTRIDKKTAEKKYGFDWEHFSKSYGFETPPPFFITNNINYVACGTKMFLDGWKKEKWRTYYIYVYMRQLIRFHEDWRSISYDFCGKFMRGQERIFPKELMCVFNLAYSFNTFLTNEYIDTYANQAAINYLKSWPRI